MACECELQNTLDVEVTQDALLDVEIGGSAGVLLQAKSVEITENGKSVVTPDDGFDGLKGVEINTNVPKRFDCGDGYFVSPDSNSTSISIMRLLQKIDVSCWNTSKLTTIRGLFGDYRKLIDVVGLNNWDTSCLNSIRSTFIRCFLLTSIDVSGWRVSSVNDTVDVFRECYALKTIIGNNTLQDVENGLKTMIGLKVKIETKHSYLRFSSILALSNGLADLTGAEAKTLLISISSYNNMCNDDDTKPTADVIAERQARIAAICAAKNWNFAH